MANLQGCPSCDAFENERLPACPLACMSDKCKTQRKPIINVHHKPVIWILGGPGCGKGTQCALLVKQYGFTHLSSGDLLRAEILSGSDRAKCLKSVMVRGGLVPNEIVINLLREEIKKLEPTSKGFLIDGYPREEHQGTAFEKAVSPVSAVIYLEVSQETLLKRLRGRAAMFRNPRIDDNDVAFKLRIDTFLHHNQRILDQYKDKLYTINAEASVEEVFAQLRQCIDPLVEQTKRALEAHNAAISRASGAKSVAATPAGLGPKSATAEK